MDKKEDYPITNEPSGDNLDSIEQNLRTAKLSQQQGDSAGALTRLSHILTLKPDSAPALFARGQILHSLGKNCEAERDLRQALAFDQANPSYLHALGLVLEALDQPDDAIRHLQMASDYDQDNAEIRNDLGVAYHHQDEPIKAAQAIREALELEPDYRLAQLNLLQVLLKLEKLDEAELVLNEIKKIDDSKAQSGGLTFSDRHLAIDPISMIKDFDERSGNISLSIVIPVFNEVDNIPILHDEVNTALAKLEEPYEIIYIDDGSTDGSRTALEAIARNDMHVRVIFFRRNYGQTAALSAGFKYARGEVVVTLDADLQNDPADIPRLLEKMAEGYDLVSGWRRDRQDRTLTRVIPSRIANRIINKLIEGTGVQLHDYGCTLKAYKRGIVKNINLYGEMHRFIPCFAAWLGVKVTELTVNHRPRVHGEAKYGLSRVPRVLFDLLVVRFFADYMTRPVQFFGKIARKLGGIGLLAIMVLALLGVLTPLAISTGHLIVLLAILMMAVLQIISMGLLGEIMVRSYFENQKKDSYIVERIINE